LGDFKDNLGEILSKPSDHTDETPKFTQIYL
jgi:hypothetical protein